MEERSQPTLPAANLSHWLSNGFAGILAGLVTVTYSISYAALIFAHPLEKGLMLGVQSALVSALVLAIVVALGGSFRFSIAGPDSNAAALLALMVSSILAAFPKGTPVEQVLPTVWLTIALSALASGLILAIMGYLRLGRLIRFIPYPVVGGFLAGTGYLIVKGSFSVLGGLPSKWTFAQPFFQKHLLLWVPGVVVALVLFFLLRKFQHFLIMPCALIISLGAYLGLLWCMGLGPGEARSQGLLFSLPEGSAAVTSLSKLSFSDVRWGIVLQQSVNMLAMMAVVFMTILLNATGIEIATMQEVDLDRDLRAAGFANLVSGGLGGMIGYLSISRSLLNRQAGATSRMSGVVAGCVCGLFLVFGGKLLGFLPRALLGGLLLYLGLSMLVEWLWDSYRKLSPFDYLLIWVILLSVAVWGFLQAVSIGVVISCLLFAFNYSRIDVIKFEMTGSEHTSSRVRSFRHQEFLETEGRQILTLCLQGYLFFGTSNSLYEYVKERFSAETAIGIRYLILDFRLVHGVDSSSVLSFQKMRDLAERHGAQLVFSNLRGSLSEQLMEAGCLTDNRGRRWEFEDLDHALERCENLLLQMEQVTIMDRQSLSVTLREHFDSPAQLQRFMGYLELRKLGFGEVLFQQGDEDDSLYFVESGELAILLKLQNGEHRRLATINEGGFVGEIALYNQVTRTAGVVAELPSRVYKLTATELQRMEREEPQLASSFHVFVIRMLAKRLSRATSEIRVLLR